MRNALIVVASFALLLLALCELGLDYPVAGWLYLGVALAFIFILIRPVPLRVQVTRILSLGGVIALIAVLYAVEWTTRKPFLRDLARVRIGMTEAEARRIMGRYLEGTGWPAAPFDTLTNQSAVSIAGNDSRYPSTTTPNGQMRFRNALVFRHSNEGAFNSDWAIISLSDGKVTQVEFSAD